MHGETIISNICLNLLLMINIIGVQCIFVYIKICRYVMLLFLFTFNCDNNDNDHNKIMMISEIFVLNGETTMYFILQQDLIQAPNHLTCTLMLLIKPISSLNQINRPTSGYMYLVHRYQS